MKKIAILIALLSYLTCLPQQTGTITIQWSENKDVPYGDYSVNLPLFNAENFQYNDFSKELWYVTKFRENGLVNEHSLQITSVIYENIDESKLTAIAKEKIPSSLNAILKNSI